MELSGAPACRPSAEVLTACPLQQQHFAGFSDVEPAAQHAFALRLFVGRARKRRADDGVAHGLGARLFAREPLQAQQQRRRAGHNRAGEAGSALMRDAIPGNGARDTFSARETP